MRVLRQKTWLFGIVGVVLVAGTVVIIKWKSSSKGESYEQTAVTRGDIEVNVQATGGVQAQNRLAIKPPVAGRIESLTVKEGEHVRKGRIVGWMSSTERVALIDAARGRGEEELKKWSELYRPTPLVAPMTGVIILRAMEPGQTVTNQDTVLVMADRLIVKTDVDETDIGRVKLGQSAVITLDAYPVDSVAGKVVHIAFDSKTVSNVTVYEVKVEPVSIPEFMKSGMTANVIFQIEKKEQVLVLPSEAITAEGKDKVVLVASKSGKGESRSVVTGITDGKRTEIISGVDDKDLILIPVAKAMATKDSRPTNPFMPSRNPRVPRR